MTTLALLVTLLTCGPTARAETFPILDAEMIEATTKAYVTGRSPALRTTPRASVALADALSMLAHSRLPLATAADVIRAHGQLLPYALRNSFEQAMRKDLPWDQVRAFTVQSSLNPDFEAILRSRDEPLVIEDGVAYSDLPRVVLDLERVARDPKRRELHDAANEALTQFYGTLMEITSFAARNPTGANVVRANEVVTQAMHWFEASTSAAAVSGLRTLVVGPASLRAPQTQTIRLMAGNLLIAKAKRTAWEKTVLACAGVLGDEPLKKGL